MQLMMTSILSLVIILVLIAGLMDKFPKGGTNWNRVNVFWNLGLAFLLSTIMALDMIDVIEKHNKNYETLGLKYLVSERTNGYLQEKLEQTRRQLATEKSKRYKIIIEKVP